MDDLKTTADKQALLKQRREEERKLGATIDHLMSSAADPTPGCGLCSFWKRLSRHQKRAVVSAVDSVESTESVGSAGSVGAVGSVSKSASSTQSRLFGMKKASASEKLAQAAAALKSRLLQLESRAASEREEARSSMKAGQKASAMRMLKRSKLSEKQCEAAQQSLLAIEQQIDMLSTAEMQKEIASALASSSKGLKASKGLVKSAEAAVDDAQDARDMAEDLSNALSELGASGNADDDELLEELQAMVNDDPPSASDAVEIDLPQDDQRAEEDKRAEIARLEARIAAWDQAEAVRQKMPEVPKKNGKQKVEEKEGLLAMDSG
jgi:hypothetical protein